MKTEPVLITSLTRRLTAIRNEAFSLIQNAVAKHRILGTFYQNLGKHYAHDQTLEQYDTAPIVITHNDSFGTYAVMQPPRYTNFLSTRRAACSVL